MGNRGAKGGWGTPAMDPPKLSELLVGDSERGIGQALWSYSSSVIHVSLYGILQSVLDPPETGTPLEGPSLAGFGTDSKGVNAQSFCLLSLLVSAGNVRNALMGWEPMGWKTACNEAQQLGVTLLSSLRAADTDVGVN